MKRYGIESESAVDADVEAASTGMKPRSQGLGLNFLRNFALPIIESLIIPSDIRIFVQAFASRALPDFLHWLPGVPFRSDQSDGESATRVEDTRSDWFLVRGAADSIQPGVERSETPGSKS